MSFNHYEQVQLLNCNNILIFAIISLVKLQNIITIYFRCAPSILITFINMVLFKDNNAEMDEVDLEFCTTNYMYAGQKHIQRLLVMIGLICIPWMLLVKPFMEMREHNQKASAR